MFNSIETFSVFFFTCLALIILGIVFEEKLIEFEVKLTNKRKESKVREKDT